MGKLPEPLKNKIESKGIPDRKVLKSLPTQSRASLEKNLLEFEQSAQLMLQRMDVILMTIGSINNEKDPTKRLEVPIKLIINTKLFF